jgi:hypothetical protein
MALKGNVKHEVECLLMKHWKQECKEEKKALVVR